MTELLFFIWLLVLSLRSWKQPSNYTAWENALVWWLVALYNTLIGNPFWIVAAGFSIVFLFLSKKIEVTRQ